MSVPLSWIGSLGLGLPDQDAQQTRARRVNLNALGGGGRPGDAPAVTGTPGSISPTPNVGAATTMPREMPQAAPPSGAPAVLPTPNDNGMARTGPFNPPFPGMAQTPLSRFATPSFVPSSESQIAMTMANRPAPTQNPQSSPALSMPAENPHLAALRNASFIDPETQVKAALDKRGTGRKVLAGVLGAVSGLANGGVGGAIQNAVSNYQGDPIANQIRAKVGAQNQLRQQQMLDQINLEKEIAGEQDRARTGNISAYNAQSEDMGRRNTATYQQGELQNKQADLAQRAAQNQATLQSQQRGQNVTTLGDLIRAHIPLPKALADLAGVAEGTVGKDKEVRPVYKMDEKGNLMAIDPTTNTVTQVPGFKGRVPGARLSIKLPPDLPTGQINALADQQTEKEYKNQIAAQVAKEHPTGTFPNGEGGYTSYTKEQQDHEVDRRFKKRLTDPAFHQLREQRRNEAYQKANPGGKRAKAMNIAVQNLGYGDEGEE